MNKIGKTFLGTQEELGMGEGEGGGWEDAS